MGSSPGVAGESALPVSISHWKHLVEQTKLLPTLPAACLANLRKTVKPVQSKVRAGDIEIDKISREFEKLDSKKRGPVSARCQGSRWRTHRPEMCSALEHLI